MNSAKTPLRVLALSGSLRAASSNTTLLHAAVRLAPPEMRIEIYEKIGDLPHFNFDLDGGDNAPPAVRDFRVQLRAADAILICCPEYAHGVPGSFKNALDWIVSSGELMEKPVALLNASPSSFHAHDALRETLSVMMAHVLPRRIPLSGNKLSQDEMLRNLETAVALREVLDELQNAVLKK